MLYSWGNWWDISPAECITPKYVQYFSVFDHSHYADTIAAAQKC